MSEINNTTSAVENTPANSETVAIAVPQEFDFAAMVAKSNALKDLKPVLTLTAEYVELQKPGEHFDGVYIGTQLINVTDKQTGEQKELTAARFLVEGKVKINAGAVIVSELVRANVAPGTALRVTYERKDQNTKIYSLTLLG